MLCMCVLAKESPGTALRKEGTSDGAHAEGSICRKVHWPHVSSLMGTSEASL